LAVKILILELDVIYKRIDDLHDFWGDFISFLSIGDYDYLIHTFDDYPDFLKKVSPYLYGLAPTLGSILEMEDEEERKEELKRIHELTRGERKRLKDNLEEIIINSYEDLIYDITGSDEIRETCRREVVEPIMGEMKKIKKEKIEMADWLNDILHVCTTELFREIEWIVMGKYVYGREIGGLGG